MPIQKNIGFVLMIIDILQGRWQKNKAKGLLSQADFSNEIVTGVF
jgi:hypothetical protein